MKKWLLRMTTGITLIAFVVFALNIAPQQALAATTTTTFITAGNTWIAPPGVTSIQVEAWGGGGAGGQRTTNGGGGGGAGGEYAKETSVTVTPGTSYSVTVGAAGTTATPTNGGNSQFIGDNVTILAHGGASVANNTTTGAATTTGSTNSVHFNGAKGVDAPSGTSGGGGGSSAGTATFGNTGSGITGGVAPTGGGVGGNGTATGNSNGSAPASGNGGGGGGGDRSSSGTRTGGAGAIGKVVLTYTTPLFEKLTDDFSSGSPNDPAKWTSLFGTVTNVSSQIVFSSTVNVSGYSGMDSQANYDLTGSYFEVQVVDAGNQALTGWETFPIQIFNGSSANALKWHIALGNINAYKVVASAQTELGSSIPYNSTTMKYFRIRESGGTTFWDYSGDGIAWTNYTSTPNPITETSVFAELVAGNFNTGQAASSMTLDNVNIAPTPAGSTGTQAILYLKNASVYVKNADVRLKE